MLDKHARVLHYRQTRRSRLLRRFFTLNSQLHPHYFRANSNRALDHFRHVLRSSKNIHKIYLFRHILQPCVALLTQHFRLIRIHRNNPVACALHVLRHFKARPHRVRRQADHRNRLALLQDFSNGILAVFGKKLRAFGNQNSHRVANSPFPARFVITRSIAAKHFSFSSAVPTEIRTASGKPIHPSGRTITPLRNSSSLSAFAPHPTSMNTKFVSLLTGCSPSADSPSVNLLRSAAFSRMHRATCSRSFIAASAAACAMPEVLNGVFSLFIAASKSGRPKAKPIRNPASP